MTQTAQNRYDFSMASDDGLMGKVYRGALAQFNLFGLNRCPPFDNVPHRTAYTALRLMGRLITTVPLEPLSPRMSNAELFAEAANAFTEAVDAYRR